jgi:hypothetical protein
MWRGASDVGGCSEHILNHVVQLFTPSAQELDMDEILTILLEHGERKSCVAELSRDKWEKFTIGRTRVDQREGDWRLARFFRAVDAGVEKRFVVL